MKKILTLAMLLSLSALAYANGNSEKAADENASLQIQLEPGSEYMTKRRWLIFPIKIYPQVSVWLEGEGAGETIIQPLYSSSKVADQNWIDAPDSGRPEALPVWSFRQKMVQEKGGIDTITSATPSGTTDARHSLDSLMLLIREHSENDWYIYLEANRSYDYNDFYTEDLSNVNGQPSLVYRARVTSSDGWSHAQVGDFELIGTGSLNGSDGNIYPDLSHITTAKNLFESIEVKLQS